MFTLILLLALAIMFFILGWLIWQKEQISLIHAYHHKKVSEEDKASYTKGMGQALIVMGIGMSLTGISDFLTESSLSWIYLLVCMIFGFAMIYRLQKKYNGGIF